MYQPSPSPSQQPHQPPTPTQAQAALQQTLCRLLHFTPEDLQWNRQGALSPAQRRRFERRRARVNVYLYLGLGLIVSGVLTISVQGITHIVPPQLALA
jgi:hypothetical protein